MAKSVTWTPGEPCPYCGNTHDALQIEEREGVVVAVCPPYDPDPVRTGLAHQLVLGLAEAARLEPDSEKIRARLAEVEDYLRRNWEIVTEIGDES